MRGILRRFRAGDKGALEALRRYIRLNIVFTVLVVAAAVVLTQLGRYPGPVPSIILAVALALTLYFHWNWTFRSITAPPGIMSWWQAGVATAAALVGVAASVPSVGASWGLAAGLTGHDLLIARFPRAGFRFVVPFVLVVGLVSAGVLLATDTARAELLTQSGITMGMAAAVIYTEVLLLRQWRFTLELEQARRSAAELATTKERLRLAEDLHDILGHALEVVSLKSELASRLSEVDPERSRAELAEVQRLARGAVHDVRALVHGRRSTKLAMELSGARGLLESAGIAWEFTGDPQRLGSEASELLGRVLREAMTNLLRHADASRCVVSLAIDGHVATLRIRNDGVAPMRRLDGEGSGLRGLARRVTEAGGSFTAETRADTGEFEVHVEVPC